TSASRRNGILTGELSVLRSEIVGGHDAKHLTVEAPDDRLLGLAQSDGVVRERLEDRLEIEGGPPDHLEQLARGRLLLQRHAQLVVARFQLGEKAGVLDGGGGLE